jgi:hypothetical protein
MNNANEELINKLKFRRSTLTEELGQQIAHIEELTSTIHTLEGSNPRPNTFPPESPFQNVPVYRIDPETYVRIARILINAPGDSQGIQRKPAAETEDLIVELGQRIREVNRIISRADQEIERLEPRAQTREIAQRIQGLQTDRDKLAGELQFYKDLKEALESKPARLSRKKLQDQRNRARDWAEARERRR